MLSGEEAKRNRMMIERLGLLFADGSILVLPEETDLEAAEREAIENDWGRDRHFEGEMISCGEVTCP
jgi:hypothetical protein